MAGKSAWRWGTHVLHLEGLLLQLLHCQNVLDGDAVEGRVSCSTEGLMSSRPRGRCWVRRRVRVSPL